MTLTNDRIGDVDLERDRMLVDHAQHGDEAAFSELYLHYHERLYRYCLRRLENRTEAEDAAQEAFARAWKALSNLAGERRFYPWLTVIASNLCVDAARKRSRYGAGAAAGARSSGAVGNRRAGPACRPERRARSALAGIGPAVSTPP